EWKVLGKHVFAGAAFILNIALMREGGYFDAGAKPLLHLWSLGIEEQFYFAWPLILAFLWKRPSRAAAAILSILGVSFGLNLWTTWSSPSVAFYFPAMRFWELAPGALLAYLTLFPSTFRWYSGISERTNILQLLSCTGAALLVASTVWIDENKAVPGVW